MLIEDKVSSGLAQLFWKIFFTDKERGVNINRHFPWMNDPSSRHWSVSLKEKNSFIGGLIVKEFQFTKREISLTVGAVGLVCISPDFRGRGCAKKMLDLVIDEANKRRYDALTLWTSQWAVYRQSGFVLCDEATLSSVKMYPINKKHVHIEEIDFPNEIGLPTFAMSGQLLTYKEAQLLVIKTGHQEDIVVSWSGKVSDTITIIEHKLSPFWKLNGRENDVLIEELRSRGASVDVCLVNLQMFKILNSQYDLRVLTDVAQFGVLDRI